MKMNTLANEILNGTLVIAIVCAWLLLPNIKPEIGSADPVVVTIPTTPPATFNERFGTW